MKLSWLKKKESVEIFFIVSNCLRLGTVLCFCSDIKKCICMVASAHANLATHLFIRNGLVF